MGEKSNYYNETQLLNEYTLVEEPTLRFFESLDYEYIHPSKFPRDNISEPYSETILRKTIVKINPWISSDNIDKVIQKVRDLPGSSLVEKNQSFYKIMIEGVRVIEQTPKGKVPKYAHIIDFDDYSNNIYQVTNQYRYRQDKEIIPDVVVFINGLPIGIIEAKDPKIGDPKSRAIGDLTRKQEDAPKLFHYSHIHVATWRRDCRYGTTKTPKEYYFPWKDPFPMEKEELFDKAIALGTLDPEWPDANRQRRHELLYQGMFEINNLMDILKHCIVYEVDQGRLVKKIARYHQFRVAVKLREKVVELKDKDDTRGGVVWHTQGSGKSLTMVFLSNMLKSHPRLSNPTIVIVTDRVKLDRQITNTFVNTGFINPIGVDRIEQLHTELSQGSGKTLLTTIHKFQHKDEKKRKMKAKFDILNDSSNIIVLADEAHRTQYGTLASNMRAALPNAVFIGFTGTPIDKFDKSTPVVFGDYIDTYSFTDAVEDGATVRIIHEERLAHLHLEEDDLTQIVAEQLKGYTDEEVEEIQKRTREKFLLEEQSRVEEIAKDIVEHYKDKIEQEYMKGQVVVSSRLAAARYQKQFEEMRKEDPTVPKSQVIYSTSAKDREEDKPQIILEYAQTDEEQIEYQKQFLKDFPQDDEGNYVDHSDELKLLIVCDMLLTGFDAPVEQVMYLDKVLTDHNLLQAIARVNRRYGERKEAGIIVDYYGLKKSLQQAISIFEDEELEGFMGDLDEIETALEFYINQCKEMFEDRYPNIEKCQILLMKSQKDYAIFRQRYKRVVAAHNLLLPSERAQKYNEDVYILGEIYKRSRVENEGKELNIDGWSNKVRSIIDNQVTSTEVIPAGKPTSIFDDDYKIQLEKKSSSDEAKALIQMRNLELAIEVMAEKNPAYAKTMEDKIKELVAKYNDDQDHRKAIKEGSEIADEIRSHAKVPLEHGLEGDLQIAYFYLFKNEFGYSDNKSAEFTKDLSNFVQKQKKFDWVNKSTIVDAMLINVEDYLVDEYELDYDKAEEMAEKIIELEKQLVIEII